VIPQWQFDDAPVGQDVYGREKRELKFLEHDRSEVTLPECDAFYDYGAYLATLPFG
jgi:hypothetical protein